MTDKRIKSYLEDRLKRLESIKNEREWTTSELGDIACCKQTLAFIDTLQEEPISDIDFEQELYKAFGQVKDFTLGMQIAKRFYEMGRQHQEPASEYINFEQKLSNVRRTIKDWKEEPIIEVLERYLDRVPDEEVLKTKIAINEWFNEYFPKLEPVREDFEKIVEEIAEPTILNAYGTKELARRLRNTICGTSVSEDLGEYINELSKQFPEVSFAKLSRIAVRVAKWQKQQMMKDVFVFESKHNTACCLASECLRNHGWFGRERDFNDLWRFICGVKELFSGEFKTDDKVKLIIIKED